MKLQKAVGLRISKLLLRDNLTRYALCKKICMSEQTLKNIMDERNKDIKLSTLNSIASGFNMSLKEFFDCDLFSPNNIDFN